MTFQITIDSGTVCPALPPLTMITELPSKKSWPKAPNGYPLHAVVYRQNGNGWRAFRVMGIGRHRKLEPLSMTYFNFWQEAKNHLDIDGTKPTILEHDGGMRSIRQNDKSPFRRM